MILNHVVYFEIWDTSSVYNTNDTIRIGLIISICILTDD